MMVGVFSVDLNHGMCRLAKVRVHSKAIHQVACTRYLCNKRVAYWVFPVDHYLLYIP